MKFTIQRDGRITDVRVERRAASSRSIRPPSARCSLTRQLPPLPAQFTEHDLTVHLIFITSADAHNDSVLILAVASRGAAVVATQQPARAGAAQPAAAVRDRAEITADPGAPPSTRCPTSSRCRRTPRRRPRRRRCGQVLWDDLDFEREFYMIPRDTYASIPPARIARRRAVRSLARARRRRRRHRHRPEDGQRRRGRGAAVQRAAQQSVFATRVQRDRRPTRASFAHTIADEIHQQQRALRAWRGRS